MPPCVLVDVRPLPGASAPAPRVAYVTLNRPDKRNGLDLAMFHGLVDAARQVRADRSVRAVILAGGGAAFCAGLDFAAFGALSPWSRARAFVRLPGVTTNLFQRACWVWRELPVPVIAVTHGHCLGGGMQLALAADFRISSPDCRFSVMEARWGLIPDMTGSVTLRDLLPRDVALKLTMTGETFDAATARAHGLVTEIADDPCRAAEALAAQVATRSPDSVALAKRLLRTTWSRTPRWAFWTESALQARLLRGANHAIARRANQAGSAPEFRERQVG